MVPSAAYALPAPADAKAESMTAIRVMMATALRVFSRMSIMSFVIGFSPFMKRAASQ